MQIKGVRQVFDKFVGGTLTTKDGGTHPIGQLDERNVGHDHEVWILTTDGKEFMAGYEDAKGVLHDGKFYIEDDSLVLSHILEPRK